MEKVSDVKSPRSVRIAHLGTYPPRACGIATYTQDVVTAVHSHVLSTAPVVVAMTTESEECEYTWPVAHTIAQEGEADYVRVAEVLNASVDLVSIQHEHGIYGGPAGIGLAKFIDALSIPVVTTLHTVLPEPDKDVSEALRAVARRSERIVVLNSRALPLLQNSYDIPTDNVTVIPHGTPDVDPLRRPLVREAFGVEGQTVLSTFGLISPGKGLEHAIEAVAKIADKHPNLHYYILGRTHPGIVRHSGESYREGLAALAEKLGVADRIHFVNKYLSLEELTDWLLATDVYVTPYLNPNQITSGTLAYAVAAGKPVVSTPYLHAQELLECGRGRLTPFNNPEEMAQNLHEVLSNSALRREMERKSWAFGRTSSWSVVGQRYWDTYCEALDVAGRSVRVPLPTLAAKRTVTAADTGRKLTRNAS